MMKLGHLLVVCVALVTDGYCDLFHHCGQVLNTSESGNITSPNYPSGYPPNLQCEWVITVPQGQGIIVKLVYFFTDIGGGDTLQCFENQPGSLRNVKQQSWKFTGLHNDKTITTLSNKLWVLFQTDEVVNDGRGFYLTYHSFNRHECHNPGPIIHGSRTYPHHYNVGQSVSFSCDPGYTLVGRRTITCAHNNDDTADWTASKPYCRVPCMSDIHEPGSSGSFYIVPNDVSIVLSPTNYHSNNQLCTWELRLPPGYRANISMEYFDLRTERRSYLEIWDGSWSNVLSRSERVHLLGNFTSNVFPSYILTNDNAVALKFQTGSSTSKHVSGDFKLVYTMVQDFSMDPVGCIKPPEPKNMYYLPLKAGYVTGDRVEYRCKEGFFLTRDNNNRTVNTCIPAKHWNINQAKDLPKCVATCMYWNESIGAYRRVVLTNSTGVIYNAGYPHPLQRGRCGYMIKLNEGQAATIYFQLLHLVQGLTISIYESDKVNMLGTEVKRVTSQEDIIKTSKHIINIIVNKTSEEAGGMFILKYESFLQNQCDDPGMLPFGRKIGHNERFTVGSTITYQCKQFFHLVGSPTIKCLGHPLSNIWNTSQPSCTGVCGGDFTAASGTVVSPNYPNHYSANQECKWNITSPSPGLMFLVNISKVELSISDSLLIRRHNKADIDVGALCTNTCSGVQPLVLDKSFMVEFKSGEIVAGSGGMFEISFELYSSCTVPEAPVNGRVTEKNIGNSSFITYQCDPPYELIGAVNATCKEGSDGQLSWSNPPPRCAVIDCQRLDGMPIPRPAGQGAIVSLGYPTNTIKGSQNCKWQIYADSGSVIFLHFRYVEILSDSFIDIYEGFDNADDKSLIVRITDQSRLQNITSRTSHVTVHYKSGNRDTLGFRGFYLQYSEVQITPSSTTKPGVSSTTSRVTLATSSIVPPTTEVITSATPVSKTSLPTTTVFTTQSTIPTVWSTTSQKITIVSKTPAVAVSTATPRMTTTVSMTTTKMTTTGTSIPSPSVATTTKQTSVVPLTPSKRPSSTLSPITPSTSTTQHKGRTTVPTTRKLPIVPSKRPPSISPGNQTEVRASTEENSPVDGGVIAAAIVVPVLILIIAGIGFLMWYRKKYPVRMTFGRHFGKFTNPVYDNQKSPVTHNLSLVRDPNSPLPNYSLDRPSHPSTEEGEGQTNEAFTFDFENEVSSNSNGLSNGYTFA